MRTSIQVYDVSMDRQLHTLSWFCFMFITCDVIYYVITIETVVRKK